MCPWTWRVEVFPGGEGGGVGGGFNVDVCEIVCSGVGGMETIDAIERLGDIVTLVCCDADLVFGDAFAVLFVVATWIKY